MACRDRIPSLSCCGRRRQMQHWVVPCLVRGVDVRDLTKTVWNPGTALTVIPPDADLSGQSDTVAGTVSYLASIPATEGHESENHFTVLRLYEGTVPGSVLVRTSSFILADGPGAPEEGVLTDITLDDGTTRRDVILTPRNLWMEAAVGSEAKRSFAVQNWTDDPVAVRIDQPVGPPFSWEPQRRDSRSRRGLSTRHYLCAYHFDYSGSGTR